MKLLFYSRSRFARRAFSVKSLFSPSFFPPKLTAIKGRCGKVKARQFSDQLQRREALEDTHIKEEQTRRDESDIFVSNPWLTFANKDFPVTHIKTPERVSYFTKLTCNQYLYIFQFFYTKSKELISSCFTERNQWLTRRLKQKSHIKKMQNQGEDQGPKVLENHSICRN